MPPARARSVALLLLAYVGFISLGLPDGLLGVAWPSIRSTFGVPLDALGALLIVATAGYVVSSFASGPILRRMNLGSLLGLSAAATAASLLGYAAAPAWGVMVAFGALAGLGAGAIDAGLNTYVATHHSGRTVNLLHSFYGLGTAAGPMIMTSVLMAQLPWQRGYTIVATGQIALAICFFSTRSLWPVGGASPEAVPAASASVSTTLRLPLAWLGMAAFLLYVGIEAAAGAWVYTVLSEARGLSMSTAGASVSLFWGGLMLGRLLLGLLPETGRPASLLRLCTVGVAGGATMVVAGLGPTLTLAGVALLGFASGPIFPTLIATTPARVGEEHTANTVGFQVAAAALGQSLLPAFFGIVAQRAGLEAIPLAILLSVIILMCIVELLAALQPDRSLRMSSGNPRTVAAALPDSRRTGFRESATTM